MAMLEVFGMAKRPRGDDGGITIGRNSNIQDNAVLHTSPEYPTILADEVTIGHGALLEGCTIESGAIVGMGAIVLENTVVEEHQRTLQQAA